jgi:hypothetical protein
MCVRERVQVSDALEVALVAFSRLRYHPNYRNGDDARGVFSTGLTHPDASLAGETKKCVSAAQSRGLHLRTNLEDGKVLIPLGNLMQVHYMYDYFVSVRTSYIICTIICIPDIIYFIPN